MTKYTIKNKDRLNFLDCASYHSSVRIWMDDDGKVHLQQADYDEVVGSNFAECIDKAVFGWKREEEDSDLETMYLKLKSIVQGTRHNEYDLAHLVLHEEED